MACRTALETKSMTTRTPAQVALILARNKWPLDDVYIEPGGDIYSADEDKLSLLETDLIDGYNPFFRDQWAEHGKKVVEWKKAYLQTEAFKRDNWHLGVVDVEGAYEIAKENYTMWLEQTLLGSDLDRANQICDMIAAKEKV